MSNVLRDHNGVRMNEDGTLWILKPNVTPLSVLAQSIIEMMEAGADPTPELMHELAERDQKIEALQTLLVRCGVELRKGPQTVENSYGSPLTNIPALIKEVDAATEGV